MNGFFRIGNRSNVRATQAAITEFIENVIPEDERPLVVTDDASVLDLTTLEPAEVIDRCVEFYGRAPSPEDLTLPLWQLVTLLRAPKPA